MANFFGYDGIVTPKAICKPNGIYECSSGSSNCGACNGAACGTGNCASEKSK